MEYPDLNKIDYVLHLTDTGFITFKENNVTVASTCLTTENKQTMVRTDLGWSWATEEQREILRNKYVKLVDKKTMADIK